MIGMVLVALGTAACGRDSGGRDEETSKRARGLDPARVSKVVPARLRVSVEGRVSFTYDDRVDLRVVTINDPKLSSLRFLSVGIEQPKVLPGGPAFRVAFDLAGAYRGAGTYELPAVGGDRTPASLDPGNLDPSALTQTFSKVYLYYWKRGDPTQSPRSAASVQAFENLLEPCRLEVGTDARSGKLTCPAVAGAGGETVSLTMEWSPR